MSTYRGHLLTPVDGGEEFAERICSGLNGHAEAVRLLEYALHLRKHGERAPGGDETWAEFDRRCEAFLRSAMDGDAPETALRSTESAQEPSVGGSGCTDAQAISGRFARGERIRPDGWACPRHGAVI